MTEWLQLNDEVFIYQERAQNLDLGPFYDHYRKSGEDGPLYRKVALWQKGGSKGTGENIVDLEKRSSPQISLFMGQNNRLL